MSLTISSPTNGTVISGSSVTLLGTSAQSVDGQVLPVQSFSLTKDVSSIAPGASFSLSIQNSSGDSASVSLVKQQVESADGATVTNNCGKALYDASLNAFTVVNGVVYKNGSTIGYSSGIALLLYFNKKFYSKYVSTDGKSSSWWLLDSAGNWGGPYPDPRYPVLPFWGVNGHITWNWTPNGTGYNPSSWANVISKMQDLGMKGFRNGLANDADATTFINFIDNYAKPAGIVVTPVLLGDWDPGGNPSNNESTAYTVGFNLGVIAARLKGRVPHYEVGNEVDSYAIISGAYNGTSPSHYDNRRFTLARGYIRGMIDGIRSVDNFTPIAMNGIAWLHTGFLDMLYNGTQPDGTSGYPKVNWDITCAHWYTSNYAPNDNPEYSQNGFNLLAHLASYGKPIHINEYGVNSDQYSNDETAIKNALVGQYLMNKWYSTRATYNITHCAAYQLVDAGSAYISSTNREMCFGLVKSDGVTLKDRYSVVKSYVAGHAV